MKILATLPAKGRDLRLDLFRGVANWGIFLDHIPNNIVNWVTTRNYGFSDAADLFIFISGYTVSFVFARMMLERGFIVGASRLLKRVWQIYVAHVFLFVLYLAEIGYVAQRYGNSGFTDEFNIRGFLANPAQFLFEGLILRFKPVNMDVLPLYIVLMGVFPPILWLMLRRPNMTLAASGVLYLMARHFGWNVSAYPTGVWYFNPFAWQFLFTFGAWFALGGSAQAMPFIRSRTDQPRALSLAALRCVRFLCRSSAATRLAGAGMADLSARDQVRAAVARSLLRRHIPVLCCPCRVGRDFRRCLDADLGQHCRCRDDDRAGVLPVVVEER